MRAKIVGLLVVFGLIAGVTNAQVDDQRQMQDDKHQQKTTFKLEGEQGQCMPLENALSDVEGVELAEFDWEENSLTVTFDSSQVNEVELEKELADIGYYTEKDDLEKEMELEKKEKDKEKETGHMEEDEDVTGEFEEQAEEEIKIVRCGFIEDTPEMENEPEEDDILDPERPY